MLLYGVETWSVLLYGVETWSVLLYGVETWSVLLYGVETWSVLLYGVETWSVTQQDMRRLNTLQMRCLRDIVGVTLWDMRRNVDILEETGELPIKEQLRLKRLQWFGHLQRMPDHQLQKQVLRCRLKRKKRRPGGTCLRWVDVISRDLTEILEWREVVTDRSAWQNAIHQPRSSQS